MLCNLKVRLPFVIIVLFLFVNCDSEQMKNENNLCKSNEIKSCQCNQEEQGTMTCDPIKNIWTDCDCKTVEENINGVINNSKNNYDNNNLNNTKEECIKTEEICDGIDNDCDQIIDESCLLWKIQINNNVESSPAIDENGIIYFGSLNSNLYAVNPSGSIAWTFEAKSPIKRSPSIGTEGTIYISPEYEREDYLNFKARLYAVDNTGLESWQYIYNPQNMYSKFTSPSIDNNGDLYIGADLNSLQLMNQAGSLKWIYELNEKVYSYPVISNDSIYFYTSQSFFSLNKNGELIWNIDHDTLWYSYQVSVNNYSAVITRNNDGTLYIGSDDGLFALNEDGSLKWKLELTYGDCYTPVIGRYGRIYLNCHEQPALFAVGPEGQEHWKFYSTDSSYNSPLIGEDDTIYFGSDDGYFYAVDINGRQKWKYKAEGKIRTSATIDNNGVVYFGSGDDETDNNEGYGYLYAIQTESKRLADTPWPKFKCDLKNTGRSAD